MVSFQGEMTFRLPLAEVAARLSDAGYLAHCLQQAEVVEATPDRAVWRIKPAVSFLTGTQTTELIVVKRRPDQSVQFRLTTRSIGATSTVDVQLRFEPLPGGGTHVPWTAQITELTGLLKMVPQGLLEGAARKVIDEVWTAVAARLEPPAPAGR